MSKELIELLRAEIARTVDLDMMHHNAANRIEELERELNAPVVMSEWQELIQQRDALLADNERLREALTDVVRVHGYEGGTPVEALAATPAQSLDALLDPYKAHIARLQKAIGVWENALYGDIDERYRAEVALIGAFHAVPAQSLARIRNQVREQCIEVARLYGTNRTVEEIRARKEPE